MSAIADIYLLAGTINALMERDDFTEEQRRAVRAIINSGNGEGPQMTIEDVTIVRALALELSEVEQSEIDTQAKLERQRY